MASIDSAARGVKDDLSQWLSEDLVNAACESAGHRWRVRKLTPVVLLRLFVMQVLMGNIACRAVRHLTELRFTTQAYHKARLRLPLAVIWRVASAWWVIRWAVILADHDGRPLSRAAGVETEVQGWSGPSGWYARQVSWGRLSG